jgi:pSer/pThr/pTyr-binding forkhead associated (FHA) protein
MWHATEHAAAMVPDVTMAAARPATGTGVRIVLEPVSHPELAPIQIHDNLFAIGRAEAPFDAYPPELAAELSRRHARIFCEHDAVYLADLGSTNGTSVNGAPVRTAIVALRDGDVLGLGKALRYRVRLEHGPAPPPRARLACLTLTPKHEGTALQTIVVTEFPFLISKTEDTFARYRDGEPTQVNYLSRRHAHLFLKGGEPYVEDLGSTNGTFVNGTRLDEQAVPLHDGDALAFGGRHFVYRVGMQWEEAVSDTAPTRIGVTQVPPGADADRTTFVAAADSFLDIFCVEPAPAPGNEPEHEPVDAEPEAHRHGRLDALAARVARKLGLKTVPHARHLRWAAAAALALVVVLGWALLRDGSPESRAEDLLASGDYARAAAVAATGLDADPGNVHLRALDTEAQLKAGLPPWMAAVDKREFGRAAAQVAAMRRQGRSNPELAPLLAELDWIVRLRAYAAARGGAQAPVRDAADAAQIRQFLKQWEDQGDAYQRAFVIMSAHVPAYRDAYAAALSDIRKLALQEASHEAAKPESAKPETADPETATHDAP